MILLDATLASGAAGKVVSMPAMNILWSLRDQSIKLELCKTNLLTRRLDRVFISRISVHFSALMAIRILLVSLSFQLATTMDS